MRSLELGFLQRIDKALPLPALVFAEAEEGGLYFHPHPGEELICGIWTPRDAGIIVCATNHGSESTAGTLAHEWRHHWQWHHGWKFDSPGWKNEDDYNAELRLFFSGSKIERDALRFEIATVGISEEWREILEGII